MFEYIKGDIEYISPQYIVVENNGIGYQIYTPNPYTFNGDEKNFKVYTYFHVREDAHLLYGFKTLEEKEFFLKLINVSGIGPKGALAILASGAPSEIAVAIEQENEKFLVQFPGVGKKTARQIILDLKGKLEEFIKFPSSRDDSAEKASTTSKELDEAILALEALGYSQREIKKVVPKISSEQLSTDQFIKLALKHLINI